MSLKTKCEGRHGCPSRSRRGYFVSLGSFDKSVVCSQKCADGMSRVRLPASSGKDANDSCRGGSIGRQARCTKTPPGSVSWM